MRFYRGNVTVFDLTRNFQNQDHTSFHLNYIKNTQKYLTSNLFDFENCSHGFAYCRRVLKAPSNKTNFR